MHSIARPLRRPAVYYPESDGQPIADNTVQFEYIVTIKGGLDAQFADEASVFIAGDLLWYPVEGEPSICQAPDVFAAFGRPKGDRGCYKQWEEGGIAPQVVFEIWSPNNRPTLALRKFEFYERHGVEEYYLFDPGQGTLDGWLRTEGRLQEIPNMFGWVSPGLQVRFELKDGALVLYHPDGRRFATFVELEKQRAEAVAHLASLQAQAEKERRDREAAQTQAEKERRDREAAQAQIERLAAQLRALGIEPEE